MIETAESVWDRLDRLPWLVQEVLAALPALVLVLGVVAGLIFFVERAASNPARTEIGSKLVALGAGDYKALAQSSVEELTAWFTAHSQARERLRSVCEIETANSQVGWYSTFDGRVCGIVLGMK